MSLVRFNAWGVGRTNAPVYINPQAISHIEMQSPTETRVFILGRDVLYLDHTMEEVVAKLWAAL